MHEGCGTHRRAGRPTRRHPLCSVEAMSDNELRNVRSAPKKATNANCWWLTYKFAPVLAEIADNLLRMRYAARRKNKTPNA